MTNARARIAETNSEKYTRLFHRLDRNDDGKLSYHEALMCLSYLGLHPKTKSEQIEFTLALEEICDETNFLGPSDFANFLQNIREIVCSNERRAQLLHAVSCGFPLAEARVLRVMFDRFYASEIDFSEWEHLLVMMEKQCESSRRIFDDVARNGKIDFNQFVGLMAELKTQMQE